MTVELCLRSEDISEDDLVEIFKRFCTAFEIEFLKNDERDIRRRGINDLTSGSEFEYRAGIGIKFYAKIVGKKQIRFHGYDSQDNFEEKDAKFRELVLQYFSDRIN